MLLFQGLAVVFIFPLMNVSITASDDLNPLVMVARVLDRLAPWFGGPATLLKVVLVCVALAGVLRRWPGTVRASLYLIWLFTLLHVAEESLPWYVDGAACVVVLMLVGWQVKRMHEMTIKKSAKEVE